MFLVRKIFLFSFSRWAVEWLDNFYHNLGGGRTSEPLRGPNLSVLGWIFISLPAPGSVLGRQTLGMATWVCLDCHEPPKEQFQKWPGSVSACPCLTQPAHRYIHYCHHPLVLFLSGGFLESHPKLSWNCISNMQSFTASITGEWAAINTAMFAFYFWLL